MKILELVGINKNNKNPQILELSSNNQNHIGTMHAAAQFLLAETASGVYLQEKFSELKDDVIPLLRESQIKYRKTAEGTITARAFAELETLERFKDQFLKRSRAIIGVNVKLYNKDEVVVAEALFTWFVQRK